MIVAQLRDRQDRALADNGFGRVRARHALRAASFDGDLTANECARELCIGDRSIDRRLHLFGYHRGSWLEDVRVWLAELTNASDPLRALWKRPRLLHGFMIADAIAFVVDKVGPTRSANAVDSREIVPGCARHARCTIGVGMHELTTIGDYDVQLIERDGVVVRYAATHVVLPRRAVIEVLDPDATRIEAIRLMRRACILEALHHPAVPRVFECGRLDGRPWFAIAHEQGATLQDELQHRKLEVREALTLLEEMAAFLSHAHARGVLHGNITPTAIVRSPTLRLQRWEKAHAHDTEPSSDAIDGSDDVFALAKTISAALARPGAAPEPLTELLARMLATDSAMRPTAPDVLAAARAVRDAIGSIDERDVDRALDALNEDESPEIVIEYPAIEDDDDEECILLERRRESVQTVFVDLDARG